MCVWGGGQSHFSGGRIAPLAKKSRMLCFPCKQREIGYYLIIYSLYIQLKMQILSLESKCNFCSKKRQHKFLGWHGIARYIAKGFSRTRRIKYRLRYTLHIFRIIIHVAINISGQFTESTAERLTYTQTVCTKPFLLLIKRPGYEANEEHINCSYAPGTYNVLLPFLIHIDKLNIRNLCLVRRMSPACHYT